LRNNYELQIQFVDRELGRFIAKLRQVGMYDSALIVITSDHGVSWKPEAPGRVLSAKNADMIFPVPLFIKLPGQIEARVSSQDAQLIDLTPTIAAVAGVRVPWQTAGHDLFTSGNEAASAQAPVRPAPQQAEAARSPVRQKIMVDASGRRFVYPPEFAESGARVP
jgi:arylsulfatase A-like enzyme